MTEKFHLIESEDEINMRIKYKDFFPLGSIYYLGEYYVERFSLNDFMKTLTIYLSSD